MDVTLGLSSEQLETILKEAGLTDGATISVELLRKSIASAITANNASIITQLSEMMGQFNIASIMQQFMK